MHKIFHTYMTQVRPKILEHAEATINKIENEDLKIKKLTNLEHGKTLVIINTCGNQMSNLSSPTHAYKVQEMLEMPKQSCTDVRKSTTNAAASRYNQEAYFAINEMQCHGNPTANKHYKTKGNVKKQLLGFQLLQELTKVGFIQSWLFSLPVYMLFHLILLSLTIHCNSFVYTKLLWRTLRK